MVDFDKLFEEYFRNWYAKNKDKITPEINARVEDTLNEWFGVEYELIET